MISRSLPKDVPVVAENIRNLGVIFKTHLDLGFTNLASEVFRRYMEDFMPRAVSMALESEGKSESFVWTTGSWLVNKYLSQSKGGKRKDFEQALGRGLIRWHALPFTFQTEALEESLLQSALRISQRLDERFGTFTRAAKMTDVPGHTRGLIPALASAGVRFLHIGVNPASQVPKVPRLFRWQHPGGSEIVVCCDGTYGGYCPVPGHAKLFALSMTGDNAGPPGWETVHNTYRDLQRVFPSAKIRATTLEELADAVWKVRSQLPLVTSEIGDTWIHGYGSDPWKMGGFRHLAEARKRWISEGTFHPESRQGRKFDELLLLSMEHTWGLDEKTWMCNGSPLSKITSAYRKEEFNSARKLPAFRKMESSWEEQRNYLRQAAEALPEGAMKVEAGKMLQSLIPAKRTSKKLQPAPAPGEAVLELQGLSFSLAPDGSFVSTSGRVPAWLGRLTYDVYGGEDYQNYLQRYVRKEERHGVWAPFDFNKPGCEQVLPRRRTFHPSVTGWKLLSKDRFLLSLGFCKEATGQFGAPELVEIEVQKLKTCGSMEFDLRWFNKPACRMGEALWFGFRFPVNAHARWTLQKLGGPVDPLDVVPGGNRHLHIVHGGVETRTPSGDCWRVASRESALVAPGCIPLVQFSTRQPNLSRDGVAFNLYNNTWGTNFPMWYEDNARFGFVVSGEWHQDKESRIS